MSASCHQHANQPVAAHASPRYRRVLWIALVVNAAMFIIEIAAGLDSRSVSLLADAVDFFGDAANYALSLAVLGTGLLWRARAAWIKGLAMAAFGWFVIGRSVWVAVHGGVPEPATMGAVGVLALAANVGVAVLLYRWREGDANMRSVWLCSRNDAIGNVAVIVAAAGVSLTGTKWPDLVVAVGMAALALTSAWSVMTLARAEMRLARSERQAELSRASASDADHGGEHSHAHGPS